MRHVSADESTLCTPLMDLATATDLCTCALVSRMPVSITTPLIVVTLMSVDAEFLMTALDAIRERHGSVAAYAADVLGVTPAMQSQMAANLVE